MILQQRRHVDGVRRAHPRCCRQLSKSRGAHPVGGTASGARERRPARRLVVPQGIRLRRRATCCLSRRPDPRRRHPAMGTMSGSPVAASRSAIGTPHHRRLDTTYSQLGLLRMKHRSQVVQHQLHPVEFELSDTTSRMTGLSTELSRVEAVLADRASRRPYAPRVVEAVVSRRRSRRACWWARSRSGPRTCRTERSARPSYPSPCPATSVHQLRRWLASSPCRLGVLDVPK